MAVAHSAASESHTGTTGSTSQTSFSWTHTQTGTPQGVLVFVHVANSTGNPVSSVTYGSVTLTRVSGGAALDSAGEAGRTDLFFAGSGLGAGNQTVTVNRANTTDIMYASAATVTALTNTNVTGIVLLQADGVLTVQSVTDGGAPTNSLRYAAAYSGLAAPPPAGTGSTLLNSADFGNYGIALVCETTAGTGARNVGFNNLTTDDRAAVHVAVRELWNRTDTETVGAFTLTGNAATLTKTSLKVMVGGTGAFTLTGQPADLRHNPKIDGVVGAFTHTGHPTDLRIGHAIASDVGKFFLPEKNLLKWSEDLLNTTPWRYGSTLSNFFTAALDLLPSPIGSINQTVKFVSTATTSQGLCLRQVGLTLSAVQYTTSVYAYVPTQAGVSSWGFVFDFLDANATSTTTYTQFDQWVRINATSTITTAGNKHLDFNLRINGTTPTGAGVIVYLWGAQLEQGSAVSDYDPTGPAGATDATLFQAHRLDGGTGAFTFTGRAADTLHNVRIDGGTGAFSLVGQPATLTKAAASSKTIAADRGQFTLTGNPASTLVAVQLGGNVGKFFLPERNLVKFSEEIDNSAWTKVRSSISPNATISPDGLLRGDKVVEDTSNNTHILQLQNSTPAHTAGVTYTYSWHLKAGERTLLNVAFGSDLGTFNDQAFDINLSTGVISNVSPSGFVSTPTATSVGNGWYRVSATVVANSSTLPVVRGRPVVGGTVSYLGDGVSGYFIWGAQLEQASAVSDYDPTGPAGATDTALRQQYKLTAEVGVFAHTGQPATLAKGRTFTAETGTFTATGQPATLRHNPRIEAAAGNFALSGGAPSLLRGRYLSGGAGEFIETGQPATFRRTWAIQATTGAFSFTGNPAALTELGAYEIDPLAGAFALTGNPANLAQTQSLPANTGTYALTGNPAALTQGYRLEATTGAFAFTGNPAALTTQAVVELTAAPGTFTLTGGATAFTLNRILPLTTGAFTLTGNPATLALGGAPVFSVSPGTFTLTGNPAAFNLVDVYNLDAASGNLTLTGTPTTFTYDQRRRVILIF